MKYSAGITDNDSAIDVTPMTNVDNRDGVLHIVNFVDDAIIPNTDAPPARPVKATPPVGLGLHANPRIASRTRS